MIQYVNVVAGCSHETWLAPQPTCCPSSFQARHGEPELAVARTLWREAARDREASAGPQPGTRAQDTGAPDVTGMARKAAV